MAFHKARAIFRYRAAVTGPPVEKLVRILVYGPSRPKDDKAPGGVLAAVRERFSNLADTGLGDLLEGVYEFRNTYVAHSKDELDDRAKAEEALHSWIDVIHKLSGSLPQSLGSNDRAAGT